ncbi:MAG: ergothioneine biosynthesis protein EgtB [Cyanobacteria bacterium]|nr:ergothioneine biosynthesis protein EgtB [Cyanobacteriota bacterium]
MASAAPSAALLERLGAIRQRSEELVADLEPEDLCLQGMADASPPKWHLGHTTWFFETFLLLPHLPGHRPADSRWGFLFNSYYDAIGERHPRPQRGLLSRPPMREVMAWRRQVDGGLEQLLERLVDQPQATAAPVLALLELGLQHEQQHQELLLMDLLDGFSRNPLEPAYRQPAASPTEEPEPLQWIEHPGGLVEIGADPEGGFHFDNEAPRHRHWLEPHGIASRLVRNWEFAAFIAAGGYRRPELWMSEGWSLVQQRGWRAPRYWRGSEGEGWNWEFSLQGRRPLQPQAPVRHLSWFEADAYARWAGARLPTEIEWETAARGDHPALRELEGQVWQWTASAYRPYPGFAPAAGAVGEYNGKFMSSQMVLRGGSDFTPPGHSRPSYRNFFPPASRWMASGLRLAQERR